MTERIRAGDADRSEVVDALRIHTSEGRLTLIEFEERLAEALTAIYLDELDVVLRELPSLPAVPDRAFGSKQVLPAVPGRTRALQLQAVRSMSRLVSARGVLLSIPASAGVSASIWWWHNQGGGEKEMFGLVEPGLPVSVALCLAAAGLTQTLTRRRRPL